MDKKKSVKVYNIDVGDEILFEERLPDGTWESRAPPLTIEQLSELKKNQSKNNQNISSYQSS